MILDADSSQRASIAAALDGRSFVMDGPPGTGKSQTIANMIGVLLHAGKTVLFVSEKAAALDVVRDRLDEAGLRAYLLELHSHKATRKQVAVALGTALDTVPVPPAPMSAMDVDMARKRREQLNAYADAMNRPARARSAIRCTTCSGMIAQLQDVPAAPATGMAPADLTVEAFGEIRGIAQRLSGAWRPAAQGQTFVWRGVTEQGSLDSRLYQAASALDTLRGMAGVNAALADAAGLTRPSDAPALARLLDHLSCRPPGLPENWLTADTLDGVREASPSSPPGSPRSRPANRTSPGGGGTLAGGPGLCCAACRRQAMRLPRSYPPRRDSAACTVAEITELSRRFAADADMLQERLRIPHRAGEHAGLAAPQTFQEAADLLTLAGVARGAGPA